MRSAANLRTLPGLFGIAALLLSACGGPPTTVIAEAEGALADAGELTRKCAPDEYAAAERMLAKAKKLSEEEKYDEAEDAARAAKKLAVKARNKATLTKEECERRLAPPPPVDPTTLMDPGTDQQLDASADDSAPETVYFDYDAFDLTTEARKTLSDNASWLGERPSVHVVVEGHCDKRGSTEYNLALGEKRGQVVRKYLRSLGVAQERMALISYGEEKPIDYGDTEVAFARNRRVEMVPRVPASN